MARLGTPYVLMHWRAHSVDMQQHTAYDDVVADVVTELREQLDAALAAGVDPARIAVDPGIGFSKTPDQNWDVLGGMERLHELGHPVLIATSRKRFLGDAAGRRRRRAPAARAPRGRYDGHVGARGRLGGLVHPHPPGTPHARRGAGGGSLGGGCAPWLSRRCATRWRR